MALSMARLLAHSEHVPEAAREALRAASEGPPEQRVEQLESAARILHHEGGVACRDAWELVDLHSEERDC
jgi:hypothetical protein